MTPQERELIMGVAQRLQQAQLPKKEPEADALINKEIATQPNGVYLLTQAVILQEHALKQAQNQIEALQQEAEAARNAQPASSSFLGDLFGGSKPKPQKPTSPHSMTNAHSQQPARQQGGGFGDFMRSAGAMAVGVAGGHLLASALSDMFTNDPSVVEEVAVTGDSAEAAVDQASAGAEDVTGSSFLDDNGAGDVWGDQENDANLDIGGGEGLADDGDDADDGGFGDDDFGGEDDNWS